ncbi:MAG: hypothetical protein HS113_04010 [Verrucomicrobiales bacterium]|nr:hypothetical protein [Verrucomicrobiales bacterium]
MKANNPLTWAAPILAALNVFAATDPLDEWQPLNPTPTANRLNAVTCGDGLYVAVGELGTVVTSSDATNWVLQASGIPDDLRGVAWGEGTFVGVGDNGLTLASADGQEWDVGTVAADVRFRAVAFGTGRFVAVGENRVAPAGGQVWTSTHGCAWTRVEVPDLPPLGGIAAGPDGWVAASDDGRVFTSSDGLQWQASMSGLAGTWFSVGWGADLWVAVGMGGGMATSSTGREWSPATSGAEEWLYGVAGGTNLSTATPLWVAVGAGGKILSSVNGTNWTSRTTGWSDTLRGVAFGPAGFVAVGDNGTIQQSSSGATWSQRSSGPRDWMAAVAHGGGITVAANVFTKVLAETDMKTTLLSSRNGAAWNQRTLSNFILGGLAYGDGLFLAVGPIASTGDGLIYTSTNGVNWVQRGTWALRRSCWDAVFGNGRFVVVGGNAFNFRTNAVCLASTNGLNWTQQDAGTKSELVAVTWGNDRFVAVGYGGTVTVSPDGLNWTEQSSGTDEYLWEVAWGEGSFVAVGNEGTVLTSPDGVQWTSRASGTRHALLGVAFGGGTFVACGGEGTLLTSTDGIAWTPRASGSRQWLSGVAWAGDSFLVSGDHGVLLRSGEWSGSKGWGAGPMAACKAAGDEAPGPELPVPALVSPLQPMGSGGDTNVHHFQGIRYAPAQGIELTLAGAIPSGFPSDYDLFPVEVSEDLTNWTPWQTFLRTNRLGRSFSPWDTSAVETSRRFYRTFTNQFPTVILQPTGPHPVGRTVRWVELPSHSVRRLFRVFVWYPARAQAGQRPMRYFESKLAGQWAGYYGGSAAVFGAAFAHASHEVEFAAALPPCPVVLCSPGGGNAGTDNTDKAEDLASHGFVVFGMEHYDSLYSLEPDGAGVIGPYFEPVDALRTARVKDALGVIEHLDRWNREDPLLAGRLDPERVGMFGFSAGGGTSVEIAQRYPQCQAAVSLDGAFSHDTLRPGCSKAIMGIVRDTGGIALHELRGAIREFVESLPNDAYFFRVSGTTHGNFGDYGWFISKNARVGTLTKRSVTSFFNKYLRGVDDHFLDDPGSEYSEVMDFVRR